ncbi:tripartite tricarboxylate transporter TctB family protein [Nitratireductor pacificus]|uniref:DUF1468 domain-containing protein n=1 Tax=Nitratireductor pacificus pht-3B TaxID=391937 RepID=K2MQ22_9HYPH|nr:tripartite tricarboxylate transporter TctB family protein [Nitratireductor pacificus]EKF19417.1 hypothetical protein NA2_07994 [Nitratireductor pacificus pht-3B]
MAVFLIVVVAISVLVVLETGVSHGDGSIGGAVFPMVLGILALVLATLKLVALTVMARPAPRRAAASMDAAHSKGKVLGAVAVTGIYFAALAIPWVHFIAATAAFVLVLTLLLVGWRGLRFAVSGSAISVVFATAVYFAFTRLFFMDI